jgi:prophage antirepressor-like protein
MESQEKSLAEYMFDKHRVRVIEVDETPWFVAKDICSVLGLKNSRKAVADLPYDEKNTVTSSDGILTGPGNPNVNIINEPGLYRLIFQSRKPEAEAFKRWVFWKVLPAIRENGFFDLRNRIAELEDEITAGEARVYELEKIAADPKAVAKMDLRRYIMNRLVSTDIHQFEDGEREYYIYANNEEYVCDKEEFIAQVSACFPSAKIKKVRGHWQFWGVGTNLSH